ncbi:MAG: thioredoxin domain-containing protein [Micavibrio sp.]
MRLLLSALLPAFLVLFAAPAMAQKNAAIPEIPEALQALSERGAQMRYLGREHGMDGWIAIYQGQEQYYYITQDGKAFVTGLMFGSDGRPVTIDQVRQLQAQGGEVLDLLAEAAPPSPSAAASNAAPSSVSSALSAQQSPAERMFADVQNSNTVRLGQPSAPVIYSFIDPQCPHCHKFIDDLKEGYIDQGVVQVQIIPVGFQEGSLAQAAFLLASPDAEDRFFRHLAGDRDALLAKSDISTQAIQKNMALMQAWNFNVTPLTVYRSRTGEIRIIRGVAKDIPGLIADLPAS